MHHYGEHHIEISRSDSGFTVIVKNVQTGERITVTGPTRGIFDDPKREISDRELDHIARELAHGFARWLV
jgi:hypothetical protein